MSKYTRLTEDEKLMHPAIRRGDFFAPNAKKRGNPVKWCKRDLKALYKWASEGHSVSWMAVQLGVRPDTLQIAQKENPAVGAALAAGYAADRDAMTQKARDFAAQGSAQHLKAYMQLAHGEILGEEAKSQNGVTINVQLPFPVGQSGAVYDHSPDE